MKKKNSKDIKLVLKRKLIAILDRNEVTDYSQVESFLVWAGEIDPDGEWITEHEGVIFYAYAAFDAGFRYSKFSYRAS